jgi:hypothetical protein
MSKTIKLSGGNLGHWIAPKNDKILKDLLKYNFGKSDDMLCSNSGEEIIMFLEQFDIQDGSHDLWLAVTFSNYLPELLQAKSPDLLDVFF